VRLSEASERSIAKPSETRATIGLAQRS